MRGSKQWSKRALYQRSLCALFACSVLHVLSPGQHTAAESPESARTEAAGAAQSQRDKPVQAPLYLEVSARLRDTRAPFVSDIQLHPGAQIELQARTSVAAHVYMLHCSADAALSVFPDAGGINFRADQWVPLPAAGMNITLADKSGSESVYVIAARDALEVSDLRLGRWLTESVSRPQGARCGAELEAALAGRERWVPRRAAGWKTRKLPFALRGVDTSTGSVARAFAEQDGVVILQFSYFNVP
jgi:hypothetical protein